MSAGPPPEEDSEAERRWRRFAALTRGAASADADAPAPPHGAPHPAQPAPHPAQPNPDGRKPAPQPASPPPTAPTPPTSTTKTASIPAPASTSVERGLGPVGGPAPDAAWRAPRRRRGPSLNAALLGLAALIFAAAVALLVLA